MFLLFKLWFQINHSSLRPWMPNQVLGNEREDKHDQMVGNMIRH